MKLSKQERIGALIILAIVILALGAFLLVKPKIESIGSARETLETKRTELQNDQAKQQLKPGLREQIEAAYQQGEHLADMFFPELTSYEADDAFRAFLKQCNLPVVVESISVKEPGTSSLSVSFFTPSEVTYALKSYVSQGRDTANDDPNAGRMAALQSALMESQTIGSSEVSFTVSALTQDDIIKFVDAVNNYYIKDEGVETGDERGIRKAVSITNLSLPFSEANTVWDAYIEASNEAMATLGETALAEIKAKKENPDAAQQPAEAGDRVVPSEIDYEETLPYTYTDTFTFYSIERMQSPKAILDEQDGVNPE